MDRNRLTVEQPYVVSQHVKRNSKVREPTVLEAGTGGAAAGPVTSPTGDDDFELWDQSQMFQRDAEASSWDRRRWCRPSCIPISVILVLIVLVVLLPLLDHANDRQQQNSSRNALAHLCSDECLITLVESIPEGLVYPEPSPRFPQTHAVWTELINGSAQSIDIGSFYWTLRGEDLTPSHSSSVEGDKIFERLLEYGKSRAATGRQLRIAQSAPTRDNPNIDTGILIKNKAADVRSVNFTRLFGEGVLHTKLWVVDGQHVYLGSANMDWRSLTQVKEMGVMVRNCPCLAQDIGKIFSVYWEMGKENAQIPAKWPDSLATKYNEKTPMTIEFNGDHTYNTFISSSPGEFNPKGRTHDLDAVKSVILHAEKFVYISVMDYFPLTIYTPKIQFWPEIDNAIRSAAIDNKVVVRMLISWWNHSRDYEDNFLRSLQELTDTHLGIKIEIKRFIVPSTADQAKIPFARVNHNKYMVTDKTAYIGTSNWSGDYFTHTAGIGLILSDPQTHYHIQDKNSIRSQLESVFMRDWNSKYAVGLQ